MHYFYTMYHETVYYGYLAFLINIVLNDLSLFTTKVSLQDFASNNIFSPFSTYATSTMEHFSDSPI